MADETRDSGPTRPSGVLVDGRFYQGASMEMSIVAEGSVDSSWSVTARSSPLSSTRPSAVRHGEVFYPATGTATWTRDDGLAVEVSIVIDPTRGAQVTSFTVTAPPGQVLNVAETRYPVLTMGRHTAELFAIRGPGETGPVYVGPIRTRRTTPERLERVADLYRAAETAGLPVTSHVAAGEWVGPRQASDLIAKARKAGLLPPSPRGRKPRPEKVT